MLIAARNAFMTRRLPYDAELEYLESTGTQYVDTEIFFDDPAHTYEWEITAQAVFSNYNVYNWFAGWYYNGPFSIGIYPDNNADLKFYPLKTYFQNGQSIGDGRETGDKYGVVTHVFSKSNFTPDTSLVLLGRVENNKSVNVGGRKRIFSVKVFNNGVLVRDFIPVRVGTVGYMYDRVSGQLFGNAGTGDFVLGPDVAGS